MSSGCQTAIADNVVHLNLLRISRLFSVISEPGLELSVKRKLHPERSRLGITRSAHIKCPFFNRVVIIGTSTCFL